MKIFLYLLLIVTINTSCKPIVLYISGANKNIKFESKSHFFKYVYKKYKIDSKDLYFVDYNNILRFYEYYSSKKTAYYYATFIDKNKCYEFSPFLKEMPGCYGRILGDIKCDTLSIINDKLFDSFEVVNLDSEQRFFPEPNKKTIVYIFSTNQGSINKNLYKNIRKEINDTINYNYVYITLDKVDHLK